MTFAAGLPLRVLIVSGREPWPLNGGGRLRLYNFASWLSRGAAVTLALPREPASPQHMPPGLRVIDMTDGAAARRGHPSTRSPSWTTQWVRHHYGYRPHVWTWLDRYARPANFDVALLYGAVSGQYIDALRIPAVWDCVDELVLHTLRDLSATGISRWPRALRAMTLYAAYQRHVATHAHATVYASPIDAAWARRWAPHARIQAVTNGVDLDYFTGGAEAPAPGTLAFVGALDFPPNVEAILRFTRTIWPALHTADPHRRLLIVGRSPALPVRDLAHAPGVELHADVPDVRPYLRRASVIVVPTQLGGGVKNKVLEGCAMARPVVASPRALAGLTAQRGKEVVCASTPDRWIAQLTRLLDNPQQATRIGAHARSWVARAHSWQSLTTQLATLLTAASNNHAATFAFDRRIAVPPSRRTSSPSGQAEHPVPAENRPAIATAPPATEALVCHP